MANAPNLWATEEDDDDARQLGQLLGGWMATQVVRTVALLGIPDQLAASPRTAAELAAAIEGGRERTLTELSALAGAAGYELIRDVPIAGPRPYHAVEFRRAQSAS